MTILSSEPGTLKLWMLPRKKKVWFRVGQNLEKIYQTFWEVCIIHGYINNYNHISLYMYYCRMNVSMLHSTLVSLITLG